VPADRVSDAIFATIDFMPTLATIAGYDLADDRAIDGFDQTDLLLGKSDTGARDHYYYFVQNELQAVCRGKWKLRLSNLERFYPYVQDRGTDAIELYDLSVDIVESRNLAESEPDIVSELMELANAFEPPDELGPTGIRIDEP
jgi:arylsulfatase A-like enzyme